MKPYHLTIALLVFTTFYYGCKGEYVNPQVTPKTYSPTNTSQNQSSSGLSDTSTNTVNTAPLLGKWSLVSDSTTFIGTATIVKNYIGTPDDYFDFRADGKCYIKENGTLDTMTFKMPTNYSVIFGKSNGVQVSNTGVATPIQTPPNPIYPFTDHIVTINFGHGVITPGGFTERILQLKK